MSKSKQIINLIKSYWAGIIAAVIILFAAVFLYFDRNNQITYIIQAWGKWGIILAIFLMTVMFMTPVPSEGLIILYFKIYGIYFGTFYSWIGSIISSLVFYYIAHTYGQKIMKKLITKERFEIIDNWVKEKGTIGLLIARFLPIPAFFVNCIAGVLPSIKVWQYLWTAAVAIIPYFVGIAFMFEGISSGSFKWVVVGIIIELVCISSGYYITKKNKKKIDKKD